MLRYDATINNSISILEKKYKKSPPHIYVVHQIYLYNLIMNAYEQIETSTTDPERTDKALIMQTLSDLISNHLSPKTGEESLIQYLQKWPA